MFFFFFKKEKRAGLLGRTLSYGDVLPIVTKREGTSDLVSNDHPTILAREKTFGDGVNGGICRVRMVAHAPFWRFGTFFLLVLSFTGSGVFAIYWFARVVSFFLARFFPDGVGIKARKLQFLSEVVRLYDAAGGGREQKRAAMLEYLQALEHLHVLISSHVRRLKFLISGRRRKKSMGRSSTRGQKRDKKNNNSGSNIGRRDGSGGSRKTQIVRDGRVGSLAWGRVVISCTGKGDDTPLRDWACSCFLWFFSGCHWRREKSKRRADAATIRPGGFFFFSFFC
ncbi:uncharacterized protein LY79DRAFT_124431 [Colletotrichum navitas]|uniref:Uncharacterized protein n=1 Tax=Colletotrichum navitas TaxID=681940 RepID=A0AAD8V708_9PEZI|nr:uncharacterized protein LY79DRAFT_124431 [Colletotrichum navitas]KAK1594753.1 hypothetical protein LY79DRAFT_124431 [Colletotrichum navitas]